MSRKKKQHRPTVAPTVDLQARVERARREGRFQQALELAKQLHKYEPTPAHLELLKAVYLGRAQQLRGQGHGRDAITVLEAALRIDEANPAWVEQVAAELAQAGEVRQALALMEKLPGAAADGRILNLAADAAVQQEAAGRTLVPPSLQPDFDRVLQAFRQVEAGQDEEARQTLQGIGLRSPFLEWKVLLRGLQAYYQNDDTRALENWRRLDPERLPARLAAPLRFLIDPEFRAAQPPATQAVLQKQADRLQGSALLPPLRNLRAALETQDTLAQAFRLTEALLPTLRVEAPQMVPRLASCLYWAAVDTGPDDVRRYERIFGAPPDDPHFYRLHALAYERAGELEQAHRYWQLYEQEIASHSESWPGIGGAQATRARALIWRHMGDNAAALPGEAQMARLPPFLRNLPNRPRPLDPPAERCFQRSIELAPDQIGAYEDLFRHLRDDNKLARAEKVGRQLLGRYPEHVPMLERLGDLLIERRTYAEGLTLLQRALKGNPLDRQLREKVVAAHLHTARWHLEEGHFEEARQQYQAALGLEGKQDTAWILGRWAACEFKADNPERAEELLQQARAVAAAPVEVAYVMLTEVARCKLPRPLKTRFDREFNAGLAEPPTGAAAAALIDIVAALESSGIKYYGQKTHTKKVIAYVDRAREGDFTEQQMATVCDALLSLNALKSARQYAQAGQRKFPHDGHFPFYEAISHLVGKRPNQVSVWQVRPLLEKAERLAREMPPDDRQKALLEQIQERRQGLELLDPFGGAFMGSIFERMFGGDEDFDDDDGGWDE